jgi:Arylsulfotransferase (ASST)
VNTGHTRGEFLKAIGAGSAWIVLLNTLGCESAEQGDQRSGHSRQSHRSLPAHSTAQPKYVQAFRTRPELDPPTVEVTTQAHDTAPGYIFVAPKRGPGQEGAMIIDDRGEMVWFHPTPGKRATDFKVQYYQDRPVLTWWEGKVVQAHGVGEYVIFDNSYREIARVRAGKGHRGDLHEFLITPQDTALLTAYNVVRMDLSGVGGPQDGAAWGGIAQEVDIETGEVLFEWHSLEHTSIEESYLKPPDSPEKPFDYFHINSIDIDHDGDLLVSSRNTSTVYKVDRKTGEVLWRLGGKKSDFEMGPGTRSAYQHDARRQPDGTITIFDNGAHPKVHDRSRGIVVDLDMNEMSATLLREYSSPDKLLATSQGNVQVLPNANVFIGWGSEPFFSEFSHEGKLLFNARFPPKDDSYRAFRFPWNAHPGEDPAVVAEQGPDDRVTLYASWNGATQVESWQVLAGPEPSRVKPVGFARRDGFETAIAVRTAEPYLAVQAKDRSGRVLGTSKAVNNPGH